MNAMNKLCADKPSERKESHLEKLEDILQRLSRVSEDIKNVSLEVNSNLFGEISKPTDTCVSESVCSGSIGCFISSARCSLNTLYEALDILQGLKFQTSVNRPISPAPPPVEQNFGLKSTYVSEKPCSCEKLR